MSLGRPVGWGRTAPAQHRPLTCSSASGAGSLTCGRYDAVAGGTMGVNQ